MTNNPLLDDLKRHGLPGLVITLPAGSRFYGPEVLAKDGDLEVNAISIIDELNFRDPFKVISGTAVREVVRRACPAVLDPMKLAKVDVDAILIAAKVTSSPPGKTELDVTCSNQQAKKLVDGVEKVEPCGHVGIAEVDLREVLAGMVPIPAPEHWRIAVPELGHTIQLRPIPYESVVSNMTQIAIQMREAKQIEMLGKEDDAATIEELRRSTMSRSAKMQVETLVSAVWYVETRSGVKVTDQRQIYEYVAAAPTSIVGQISDLFEKMSLSIDDYATAMFDCPDCSHRTRIPINLDPLGFFSQKSRKEASKTQPSSTPSPKIPSTRR